MVTELLGQLLLGFVVSLTATTGVCAAQLEFDDPSSQFYDQPSEDFEEDVVDDLFAGIVGSAVERCQLSTCVVTFHADNATVDVRLICHCRAPPSA